MRKKCHSVVVTQTEKKRSEIKSLHQKSYQEN